MTFVEDLVKTSLVLSTLESTVLSFMLSAMLKITQFDPVTPCSQSIPLRVQSRPAQVNQIPETLDYSEIGDRLLRKI